MAFAPSSTIYLCNVPFDNTYKHQVYFESVNEQFNYFFNRKVKTFVDYLTVREILPDGNSQSSIKVNASIDELRASHCNYMFYQNANLGTKYIYAFITKLIYVNEGTTRIVFETDVFQSYFFDVVIKPSFVKREHSVTDEYNENLVPEQFNFNDFIQQKITSTDLTDFGYLLTTTDSYHEDYSNRPFQSGIFQGLYFYYFYEESTMNLFIQELTKNKGDCIVSISVIPKFSIGNNTIIKVWENVEGQGLLSSSKSAVYEDIEIDLSAYAFTFDGYTPKNKKLFTFPFFKLVVSNHSGSTGEFILEDFNNRNSIKFRMTGDISTNPSILLYPLNYKNVIYNYDEGVSIGGFPQCSYNTDSYMMWLAKNQFANDVEFHKSIYSICIGLASMFASSGMGTLASGGAVLNGVNGLVNNMVASNQASFIPNSGNSGNPKNNLLTSIKANNFDFYIQTIKKEHAQVVDDFFTMYGYATNKVKQPNLNSRPFFNYVETVDINVYGGIPQDYLLKFKSIFNSGVTLWKANATMYDYTVDNSPTG